MFFIQNKQTLRAWGVSAITALALLGSSSFLFPSFAQAGSSKTTTSTPGTYSVATINASVSGNTLSLLGRASVTNYDGKENELYMKFIWGDGTEEIVKAQSLPVYYKSSKTITLTGWTRTHTYASDTSNVVTVKFYRGSSTGGETFPKEIATTIIRTENTDTLCRNGIDDDRDNKTDVSDTDCARFMIVETTLELCSDGIDNDLNGTTDLADLSCKAYLPPENTEEMCSDGIDNDKDGTIDLRDPSCAEFVPPENTAETCMDGVDNDLDGKTDLKDSDCAPFLTPENTPELCTDGIDNDENGLMDGQEGSCKEHVPAEDTEDVCLDGVDNDHDGSFDWLDDDCAPYAKPPMCGPGFSALFFPGFGWICVVGYNVTFN